MPRPPHKGPKQGQRSQKKKAQDQRFAASEVASQPDTTAEQSQEASHLLGIVQIGNIMQIEAAYNKKFTSTEPEDLNLMLKGVAVLFTRPESDSQVVNNIWTFLKNNKLFEKENASDKLWHYLLQEYQNSASKELLLRRAKKLLENNFLPITPEVFYAMVASFDVLPGSSEAATDSKPKQPKAPQFPVKFFEGVIDAFGKAEFAQPYLTDHKEEDTSDTVLHRLAQRGEAGLIKKLMAQRKDSLEFPSGKSVFSVAFERYRHASARKNDFLMTMQYIAEAHPQSLIDSSTEKTTTYVHAAVSDNDLELLKALLPSMKTLETAQSNPLKDISITPLELAVSQEKETNRDVLEALLNLTTPDDLCKLRSESLTLGQRLILSKKSEQEKLAILKIIEEKMTSEAQSSPSFSRFLMTKTLARTTSVTQKTLLHLAIKNIQPSADNKLLKYLLSKVSLRIKASSESSQTPLHCLMLRTDYDNVEMLLPVLLAHKGASQACSEKDANQQMPLHVALEHGQSSETVQLLLEIGEAKVLSAQDRNEKPPLLLAIENTQTKKNVPLVLEAMRKAAESKSFADKVFECASLQTRDQKTKEANAQQFNACFDAYEAMKAYCQRRSAGSKYIFRFFGSQLNWKLPALKRTYTKSNKVDAAKDFTTWIASRMLAALGSEEKPHEISNTHYGALVEGSLGKTVKSILMTLHGESNGLSEWADFQSKAGQAKLAKGLAHG